MASLTGHKYGSWIVLNKSTRQKKKHTLWTCKCSCGRVSDVQETNLRSGKSLRCRSCGNKHRALISNKDVSGLNWDTESRECPRCKKCSTLSNWKMTKTKTGVYPSMCKACRKELDRLDRLRFPEKYRTQEVYSRYALTPEQFQWLAAQQKGVCGICQGQRAKVRSRLNVDHSHRTGKVRGLLCSSCNSLLGYANDSSQFLLKAIRYLHKSKLLSIPEA